MDELINSLFEPLVRILSLILFWDPLKLLGVDVGFRFPFVVMWLMVWGLYFTIRMGFINVRAFWHSLQLTSGRFDRESKNGEVSHFQALATALSATVGLGNIAGVAIAISIGGPGATFWMIMAGLLGMSLKFTECTLGQKYRVIDEKGRVSGGPMYYLSQGLANRGLKTFGKILAITFSILVVGASFGGGNMFQANQAFLQVSYIIPWLSGKGTYFGLALALLVGLVVLGGIKSIASVASRIVPFMVILYVATSLVVIFFNIYRVHEVFALIFAQAFGTKAVAGGFFGAFIIGFQRGAFSNEAGIGSASIAHSAARTDEPVSEGIVALLEPFIDTVVVCTMTALVINFSGLAQNNLGLQGAQLTSAAFATVFNWFPYLLAIAILLFAFSTMISWSYYGLKGFNFLFEKYLNRVIPISDASTKIYFIFFLLFVVVGSASNLWAVMDFSDMMILGMAFPNILGMLFMIKEVSTDLNSYWMRWKSGKLSRQL